jgi:hypothetical protein
MAERYDVAAKRHFDVADLLEKQGELDDAGYHYGLVGENALKHALRVCLSKSVKGRDGHFPDLKAAIIGFQGDIAVFASGSGIGKYLYELINDPTFAARFGGWNIDIRYADDRRTPVAQADCARWGNDAAGFMVKLGLM